MDFQKKKKKKINNKSLRSKIKNYSNKSINYDKK